MLSTHLQFVFKLFFPNSSPKFYCYVLRFCLKSKTSNLHLAVAIVVRMIGHILFNEM